MKKLNTGLIGSIALFWCSFLCQASDNFVLIDASENDEGSAIVIRQVNKLRSDDYFNKYTYSVSQGEEFINPWVIAAGGANKIWVAGEFSQSLHYLDRGLIPQTFESVPIRIPAYAVDPVGVNAPFSIFGQQTLGSSSEQMAVDSQGRIWFPQTGGLALEKGGGFNQEENGSYPIKANYSRIVRFDPQATENQFCIYNIPDNFSSVLGIVFQPGANNGEGLIWFTQAGRDAGVASLVSMSPSMTCDPVNYEWELDANGGIPAGKEFAHGYCVQGSGAECYKKYEIPVVASEWGPARMALYQPPNSAEAEIWFSFIYHNAIGRFLTTQEEFKLYQIGQSPYQFEWQISFNDDTVSRTILPWDIVLDEANGDIYFSEYASAVIAKIDREKIETSSGCESSSFDGSSGLNPCFDEILIPGRSKGAHQAHHLKFDKYGNLWFGISTDGCIVGENYPRPTERHVPASVGFIAPGFEKIYLFDHLWADSLEQKDIEVNSRVDGSGRLLCDENSHEWNYVGIEISDEPMSGSLSWHQNIWVVDGFLQKVRRLEMKSEENILCVIGGAACD